MQLIIICAIFAMGVLAFGTAAQYKVRLSDDTYVLRVPTAVTFVFLAVLVITSTLRFGFVDTYAYKEMYLEVRDNYDYIFTGAGWDIEPGWLWLMYMLNKISRSPKLMLFLSSLLICGAYVSVIRKYSEQVLMSLFLFFCLMYLDTNNGIRQMCAAAVLILGFHALVNKRYIQYVICALIAYQMHNSAMVIAIVAITAIGRPLNIKTICALALGVAFLFIPEAITDFLDTSLENVQYNEYLSYHGGMGTLRALVTGIIPIILSIWYTVSCQRQQIDISRADSILINLTIINGMFVMMGTYMQYWNRFTFYTFFAPIVMMPKYARVFFGDKSYFYSMRQVMIVLYLAYFAFNIFTNSGLPGSSSDALQNFYIEWWC